VERYPDLGRGVPHDRLDHRHIVADLRYATIGQLADASVLTTGYDGLRGRWLHRAETELARWPKAMMVAAALDARTCLIRTRDAVIPLRAGDTTALDPLLLASLAYARLSTTGRVPEHDRLWLGDRAIAVAAVAG
jgi:hypothetical protein